MFRFKRVFISKDIKFLNFKLKNTNFNSNGVNNTNTGTNNGPGLYRPISATELRANTKPVFGRKQFNNQTNMTANLAAKNLFGNYTQNHSTITTNGLNALKKWW